MRDMVIQSKWVGEIKGKRKRKTKKPKTFSHVIDLIKFSEKTSMQRDQR